MFDVMDILTGKNPVVEGLAGDTDKQKELVEAACKEIQKMHTAEIAAGTATDRHCTPQTNNYLNNFFMFLDANQVSPEIIVWRGVCKLMNIYKIPLSQKNIPYMYDLLVNHGGYLRNAFDDNYCKMTPEQQKKLAADLMGV